MKKLRSFTLLELLMVVMILGILAAFLVPNYFKNIQMAKQKTARAMLFLMKNGESSYFSQHQTYYPLSGTIDITGINGVSPAGLGLSVLQPADMYYECDGTGIDFTCHAYHPTKVAPVWHLSLSSTGGISCVGTCY